VTGSTTLVPVDPATADVPEALLVAGDAFDPLPDPSDPGPGDPGDPTPTTVSFPLGRRVQVMLCEPVTHRPVAELRSARGAEWTDRFGAGDATVSVDSRDPAWAQVAASTATVRGRTVSKPDLKGFELKIGVAGQRRWAGIIQEPHSWGGRFTLKAVSLEALLDERTLGATEQEDFYNGRGSFPDTDLTGWSFGPGVTHTFTASAYEGNRALRATSPTSAAGVLYGPWKMLPGQDGQVRYPVGSAVVKAPDGCRVWVGAQVQTLDGTPVNEEFTTEALGQSDDTDTGWQIVAGKGRLRPTPALHKVRVVVFWERASTISVDLVRLQWPTLTGFSSPVDLSRYPGRILFDAQNPNLGGVNMGLVAVIRSNTGIEERLTWAHQEDHPVGDAIRQVRDMDGGPDVWVTASGRQIAAARRGSDRSDITLNPHNILKCTPTMDPGGQIDELRVITSLGTGSYRHVHSYDAPRVENRRRIRQVTQEPSPMGYDAGKRWTRGQGRWASQEPFSARVEVAYDLAEQLNVGDGLPFSWDDGSEVAWWGAVRIGAITYRPWVGRAVLEVGTDRAVSL